MSDPTSEETGAATRRPPAPTATPGTSRPTSARNALVAALVALLLGALMNAGSLAETAQRQPFGWQRSIVVTATGPLETVAGVTRLDRLHAWLSAGVGAWLRPETLPARTLPDSGSPDAPLGEDTRPDATGPGDTAAPEASPPPTGTDGAAADGPPTDEAPTETPTEGPPSEEPTTPDTPRRWPDEEDPLRVWVTGDSLVEAIGGPLDAALTDRLPAMVRTDPRYSTGLARPDYFDWPAYAAEELTTSDPDLVVLMLGGNDDQDMRGGSLVVGRTDDAWEQEYLARALALLEVLTSGGAEVLWIGLPRMQDEGFDEAMREIDALQRQASEQTPGVWHVPTRDLVSDDGAYATYLETGEGVERVRRTDGVHLTPAGGGLLARARLAELIEERWTPE